MHSMKKYLILAVVGAVLGFLHSGVISAVMGTLGLPALVFLMNIFLARPPKKVEPPKKVFTRWTASGYGELPEDQRDWRKW